MPNGNASNIAYLLKDANKTKLSLKIKISVSDQGRMQQKERNNGKEKEKEKKRFQSIILIASLVLLFFPFKNKVYSFIVFN